LAFGEICFPKVRKDESPKKLNETPKNFP
jgi:hypothetical protein